MNYHEIKTDNLINGNSLRTVLWVSGCELACPHCFNPETWDYNSGKEFTHETLQELFDCLDKPYIRGLTLTGGNPLEYKNLETVYKIIEAVQQRYNCQKDVWIYTGYTWEELCAMTKAEYNTKKLGDKLLMFPVLCQTDVLVDGRFVDALKDVKYPHAGSTNQRVIDVQKSITKDSSNCQYLNGDGVVLWGQQL